jgi:hypothetical protein
VYPLQGQFEFNARRRQAFWRALRTVLTGRARTLLSYDDVIRAAGREGQVDLGVREIPLERIRGSEGRAREFDASFLPVKAQLKARWAYVDDLMQKGVQMSPIEVYQLGETYFVKDGHHRVSVARHLGQETIPAHVIEVRTTAPLDPDVDPRDLLCTAEYARFLERTQLHRVRPEARVECSHLGRYDVILDHILGHRYFLGLERGHEVPLPEAAASWYDNVFLPVMNVLREHRVAESFPGWSGGDLYLAVTKLWLQMREADEAAGPEAAAARLVDERDRREERDPQLAAMARAMRRWARGRRPRTLFLKAARPRPSP